MANFIPERLVLFEINEEMLLEMLQIFLIYFRYVFLDVRERIGHIFFTPASCVQEHIDDCLFLYQHLICFVLYPFRDRGGLSKIHTMRWWLPVILNRRPMGITNKRTAGVCCLHCVSQKSSAIKIPWQLENVWKVLVGRSCHGYWNMRFAYLFKNVFEYIFDVFEAQRITDDLSQQQFRHIA